MPVISQTLGHENDADTLVLYRMGDVGVSTDDVGDDQGTALAIAGGAVPVTDGPVASSDLKYSSFARWFDGSGTRAVSAALGAGSDLRQAQVETTAAAHTWEVLFRLDDAAYPLSTTRTLVAANNDPGATAADDELFRLVVTTTGALEFRWERSGAAQVATTTGVELIIPGQWHVVHVQRTVRTGTTDKWSVRTYLDGALVQAFLDDGDFGTGTGLMPPSTGGTASVQLIGAADASGSDPWFGAVGSVRLVGTTMDTGQIQAAAARLLADTPPTDGLGVVAWWRLDEPPSLVDTSGNSLHAMGDRLVTSNGAWSPRTTDLVGGGAFASAFDGSQVLTVDLRPTAAAFSTAHGRPLRDYFNDSVVSIPAYTIEAFILQDARAPSGSGVLVGWEDGAGETAADNVLFQVGMTAAGEATFFAETGSGTDLAPADLAVLGVADPQDASAVVHWAVRVDEDAGNPGEVLVEHFVSGQLVGSQSLGANVPQDGSAVDTLVVGLGWEGWVQDLRVSRVARSDAEILASAQNRR